MRVKAITILLLSSLVFTASADPMYRYDYSDEYDEAPEQTGTIPKLDNLQEVAKSAGLLGVPILVEFSTPWCRYCEALERQILEPLMQDEKYRDTILLVKLEVDTFSTITGFDGKPYRSDQISRMYDVDLYPTLVFFDANGREISQRIVGITVLEFVAGELNNAIERAVQSTAKAL